MQSGPWKKPWIQSRASFFRAFELKHSVIENQNSTYERIWQEYSRDRGEKLWLDDPTYLYVTGIHLTTELYDEMEEITKKLKSYHNSDNEKNEWLLPREIHITLEIQGRVGKQFEEADIPYIKSKLSEITQDFPSFSIELGRLNYFPGVIFREVYDENGMIFQLHKKISQEVPFILHPKYSENYVPHLSMCYLGEKHSDIFTHPDFDRNVGFSKMHINKIYFSKNTDKGYIHKEELLQEFELLG